MRNKKTLFTALLTMLIVVMCAGTTTNAASAKKSTSLNMDIQKEAMPKNETIEKKLRIPFDGTIEIKGNVDGLLQATLSRKQTKTVKKQLQGDTKIELKVKKGTYTLKLKGKAPENTFAISTKYYPKNVSKIKVKGNTVYIYKNGATKVNETYGDPSEPEDAWGGMASESDMRILFVKSKTIIIRTQSIIVDGKNTYYSKWSKPKKIKIKV